MIHHFGPELNKAITCLITMNIWWIFWSSADFYSSASYMLTSLNFSELSKQLYEEIWYRHLCSSQDEL